jgi:hypothetical protein
VLWTRADYRTPHGAPEDRAEPLAWQDAEMAARTDPGAVPPFISSVSARSFWRGSFFRSYQERFVGHVGPLLRGVVVEVGAASEFEHRHLVPHAELYLATNLRGPVGVIVDATATPFADGLVDGVLCVSVVEHIVDLPAAFAEFARMLRPGGTLVVTVPFCYPIHDVQDYWRMTDQALVALLSPHFEPIQVTLLGGKISTIAELMQRPVGVYGKRHLPMKAIGTVFAAVVGRFDEPDASPQGFGVVARRRPVEGGPC